MSPKFATGLFLALLIFCGLECGSLGYSFGLEQAAKNITMCGYNNGMSLCGRSRSIFRHMDVCVIRESDESARELLEQVVAEESK